MTDTLTVDGASSFLSIATSSNVTVTQNFSVGEISTFTGNVGMDGTLSVAGASSFLSVETSSNAIIAQNFSVGELSTFTGAVTMKDTLSVEGASSFLSVATSSNASIAQNMTVGEILSVAGQVQWSKGADVASNSALPVLKDGNYFDVTGTTGITSINTTGGAGTLIKLHFDGVVTITHHVTNLILAGAADFTTEAGDELEFVEYDTGKYRMTGWSLAGTAPGGGGGGSFLGEGASGASVGDSGDIIRVNQQTLDTSQTMVATDNGSATGPLAIASGVTLTISSGATFTVI